MLRSLLSPPRSAFLLATLCLAPSVRAEPGDADKARALFREARTLRETGEHEAACSKLSDSLALERGMGTQFNLADCWAYTRRTASAYKLFLEVARQAAELGQGEREKVARERARALEPKLMRLTVDVKTPTDKLTIEVDGEQLEPGGWGAARAVDPGMHDVRATAPGKKSWSTKAETQKAGETVTVEVPALEDDSGAGAAGGAAAAGVTAESAAEPEPKAESETAEKTTPEKGDVAESSGAAAEEQTPRRDLTVPIILVGGLATGAILAGTSFFLYKASNDEAEGLCPSGVQCTTREVTRHRELVEDAKTARSFGYLGLGIGVASLVTAGVISFVKSPPSREQAQLDFGAGPTPGGFAGAVRGSF